MKNSTKVLYAVLLGAIAIFSFGAVIFPVLAQAQMTGNETNATMSAGNMTGQNMTNASGTISGNRH